MELVWIKKMEYKRCRYVIIIISIVCFGIWICIFLFYYFNLNIEFIFYIDLKILNKDRLNLGRLLFLFF